MGYTARKEHWSNRMKKLGSFVVAMVALGLVPGCRVGPNYHRPVVQSPTAFRDLSENAQVQVLASSYADLPWWQVFQDPQLQELIRTALKQNYDLQIAMERINSARAQVAVTRSNLFPQVQGDGNFAGGKEGTFQTKFNFLTLTADAAFQLDFFGKLRRATEASRAQLLATEDARQTVILTLVSDVASAYFALLQLDLQLQFTQNTVADVHESVLLSHLR
jgi:multidrug efflux system outer membrane protein